MCAFSCPFLTSDDLILFGAVLLPCFLSSASWLLSAPPCQGLRSEMRSRWPSSSCRRITDWKYWRGGGGREASVPKRRTTVPKVSPLQQSLFFHVPSNRLLSLLSSSCCLMLKLMSLRRLLSTFYVPSCHCVCLRWSIMGLLLERVAFSSVCVFVNVLSVSPS